ncbi:helix-turn-helix domain-containing protein [Viridibacillus sp. FSL H8-0123]|uniref:helix-turn-helix domain-containing protein n=1 Tax=Viridibacillus sp. FSL H8-0123 TaxID=1928922 RepID=UPI00096D0AF0|nr:helix-turn-helix domain-containing protein [Viridibacillus sp. FSL H8-0123]OMC80916.1 hypothetical protein BK130_16470 [Viridibacillus sp. FSL H8-0123]
MLLNNESTYKQLASFSDLSELNAAVIEHRNQYGDQLTPATRNVLDVLARYACVYIGVCYLSKGKIAAELDISRRTVIRACDQLEALGIVKQYETKRHNGDRRRSSNAIVIQRVTAECHSVEAPAKASLRDISNTLDTGKAELPLVPAFKNQERKEQERQALKSGLVTKLPAPIQALAPFFDAYSLYNIAGTVYRAKASVDKYIALEHHVDEYKSALLSVVNAFKRGKVRDLHAVIYQAVKRLTRSILVKDMFDYCW